MSAKKHPNKRSTGHKKILNAVVSTPKYNSEKAVNLAKPEDAIVRQFRRIQKGYLILMNEVAKEFDLVRVWLTKEATSRGNVIKNKLSRGMPKIMH